jgi:hypothetical protein
MFPLSQECKIDLVSGAAAAAQTAITSSVLDMAGYDGVLFLAITGDVTDTSVLTLTAYEHTANAASGTAISGGATTPFTADASSADSKLFAVDVVKPTKQYVYAIFTRTTANAVVNSIIAIRYKGKTVPVVNSGLLAAALAIVN